VAARIPSIPPSPASGSPAVTTGETPFFFPSGERPLYAVYHSPRRERPGACGIVVCSSLGVEQLTCYRNEVLAARALAGRGFPVIRFHPRGHGDSGGDYAAVTVAGLAADALAAADELTRRSGVARLAWLGVRFGALAAAAGAAATGGAALALWEPVHRPLDYFRGLLRGLLFSQVSHGQRPTTTADQLLDAVAREGRVDVHGYYLYRTLLDSAREAELGCTIGAWGGPALLVQIQARRGLTAPHAEFADRLRAAGAAVTTELLEHEQGWYFLQNPAWESPRLIDLTREWFDAVA
jgi:pimeloyl-ACP methyl ester carboxylesterase